jgi:hypothetical protein
MFADVAGGCAATWPPVLFVRAGDQAVKSRMTPPHD